jgi:predicted dehydrogenase
MLDREKPDVAIVATPSGAHLESVLACAARKIHVVCEKPLEVTPARARQMIDATLPRRRESWGRFFRSGSIP